MNDAENVRFLSMCEETASQDKFRFIKSFLFQKELKVVKIDKAAMDYYMRLTTFMRSSAQSETTTIRLQRR
jgi:hypothetical protein